jgi:hypothetical protein
VVDETQQLTLGHGGVSHHQNVDVTPDAALAAATSTAGQNNQDAGQATTHICELLHHTADVKYGIR